MKKNILKSLFIILMLPVLVLVGCKNKELPALNLSRYIKSDISVRRYGVAEASKSSLSILTEKKAKQENLSKYLQFELTADNVWMYKMYIEKITFYVYCNESSEFQMIINLKMTDLATEKDIFSSTTESVNTSDLEEQVSITPKANKAIKCTVNINRTVIKAVGSTITLDIYNSPELFSSDGNTESNFMWLIYDFEIHGESRTYSR